MKKLLQNIQANTPKWAAKALVIITSSYSLVVALQEFKIIDILPIDPAKREAIKAWTAVIVAFGSIYFAKQKQPVESVEKRFFSQSK